MDPVSQGVLGAVASQSVAQRKHAVIAAVLGALAGIAPDLDVFITSKTDPLLFLEYHRQFTHSLIFIPVGGLLCAIILYLFANRWALSFKQTLFYCVAGYATHALLDSCTSYGTQLFWPFSDYRVAWNSISIIDPIFTLPLLALAGITAYTKRLLFARLAMLWVILYLGLGVVQRERVETIGLELALSRNHQPVRLVSRPAFGNLLLWKTIYETDDKYYVDGVRSAVDVTIFPGQSIEKLNLERDFPWLQKDSQQANDINRFEWFSSGFVAIHPNHTNRVIDVRYSMLPNEIDPLWMIELDPEKSIEQHVDFLQQRAGAREKLGVLWQMLLGRAPGNSAPGN